MLALVLTVMVIPTIIILLRQWWVLENARDANEPSSGE